MAWRGFICAALDGGVADLDRWRRRARAGADAGGDAGGDAVADTLRDLEADRQLHRLVRSGGVTLRPGAASFLAACAERGPVGIVSGLPRPLAAGVLAGAGLEDAFAFLWCGAERGADPWRRAGTWATPRWAARPHTAPVALVGDVTTAVAAHRAGFVVVLVGDAEAGVLPVRVARWPDYASRSPDDLADLLPPSAP